MVCELFWLLLFVWLLLLELSFTLEFVFDPWEFSSFDGSVVTAGVTFELYFTTITGENEYNVTVTLPLETLSGFTVCQLPLFNLCNT